MTLHLLMALAAGGLIGYERSYSGRPAGFRTHTLVCMASTVLMLLTIYQDVWFPSSTPDVVRIDPTRMAQGIMTGIGFLGAGVIVKEGASVRGLTTAASIWMTAAVGVLCGAGFYYPVVLCTALTLGTLSLFRWIEGHMPALSYVRYAVRFEVRQVMSEADFRALIAAQGFSVAEIGYRQNTVGQYLEYRGVIRTKDVRNMRRLTDALRALPAVMEFSLEPASN
jgi:putative Mg2+ transporter-C (MgtC) family protein